VPGWLKLAGGVVDSLDVPLNVSREILQRSKVLSIINKCLMRKSIDMIRDISRPIRRTRAIKSYSGIKLRQGPKVGVIEDAQKKDDIVPLLQIYSLRNWDEYTSLDKYVENIEENQKQIYYVMADGKTKAQKSPAAEKVRGRGYEVRYLTEPLDEIMIESLTRYKEYKLVDVSKEGLNFDDEDKEERKKKEDKLNSNYKGVKEYPDAVLAGKVQRVKMTDLLSDNPAALVQSAYGMSPTMQRHMKAQTVASGGSDASMVGSFSRAVLEVNPNHPIVKDLERMVVGMRGGGDDKEDVVDDETRNFAVLLYDVAAHTRGYEIEDLGDFAGGIMALSSKVYIIFVSRDLVDAEVEKEDVAVITAMEVDIMSAANEDADVNPTTVTSSCGFVDVKVE
jgi:HSP90 family molecular chaperone